MITNKNIHVNKNVSGYDLFCKNKGIVVYYFKNVYSIKMRVISNIF